MLFAESPTGEPFAAYSNSRKQQLQQAGSASPPFPPGPSTPKKTAVAVTENRMAVETKHQE